jgi:hypothetical protein
MRLTRFIAIPLVMLFILACGLTNGIQQAATQLPGMLTSAPTALGAMETVAAAQSSSNCSSTTPTSGGLGISLDTIKTVLQITNQFTFTDGTVDGQTASTATLTSTAAASFQDIANGFSAVFIGDPCNIGKITVTIPRTDQQATVDQGMGLVTILFAGFLPPGAQIPFITWLTQEYAAVPVGGQQQTTIGTMQFTLQRSQTEMVLDIVPAQ